MGDTNVDSIATQGVVDAGVTSKRRSIKGKHCYNNGLIEKYFYDYEEPPEGFVRGRLESSIKNAMDGHKNKNWNKGISCRGRKAYTDGSRLIFLRPGDIPPDGFRLGGLPKSKEWRDNIAKAEMNKITINNGERTIKVDSAECIPEGYVLGEHKKRDDAWRSRHSEILKSQDVQKKRYETCVKNKSFNKSQPEDDMYAELCEKYGDANVVRQYTDERYPYRCDFYIPTEDLFIELNRHWTHGGMPYDTSDPECIKQLEKWTEKSKESEFYRNAIKVWTVYDVDKRRTAQQNNINYRVIW